MVTAVYVFAGGGDPWVRPVSAGMG